VSLESESERGSLAPPIDARVYPQRRRDRFADVIPVVLWSLLLLAGILALLGSGPREAPAFSTLTAFTCDPLPVFSGSWRRTSPPLVYTCRSDNGVVYQRGSPPSGTNVRQWRACRRAPGVITLWRQVNPSPYGTFVFQTSCNGEIYADYKTQAASYQALHESGLIAAWAAVILSVTQLGVRLARRWRHRSTSSHSTAQ
jgi:hypothetical protein